VQWWELLGQWEQREQLEQGGRLGQLELDWDWDCSELELWLERWGQFGQWEPG
jgi:hypothetical protein